MKTRHDFVSNSSSSSFICVDNDLGIMPVYGDVRHYDVKQYLEEYWKIDVLDACGSSNEMHVTFVPNETYAASFGTSSYMTLPESARSAYDEYCVERIVARNASRLGDVHANDAWREVDRLSNKVADAIWVALKPKWKDVMLTEVIAYDSEGDEENMYYVFKSLHNPKFYRIFSHH